jgi:ankyrin repeat protein
MNNLNLDLFQVIRNGEIELYSKNIGNCNINMRNEYGQSLLHEAIAYKQLTIAMDLLNRGIDANMQDEKGQTVLHFIGFHPNLEVAEKIVDSGGDLEINDVFGNTPLWYAVFNARGNYELVKLLVKYGANSSWKNKAGRSPIDFATQIKDNTLLGILK